MSCLLASFSVFRVLILSLQCTFESPLERVSELVKSVFCHCFKTPKQTFNLCFLICYFNQMLSIDQPKQSHCLNAYVMRSDKTIGLKCGRFLLFHSNTTDEFHFMDFTTDEKQNSEASNLWNRINLLIWFGIFQFNINCAWFSKIGIPKNSLNY